MKPVSTPSVTDVSETPNAVLSSDGLSISREKLNILRHSIGYDDNGGDRYPNARSMDERRNHFVTSPKDKDGILCQELVAADKCTGTQPDTKSCMDTLKQELLDNPRKRAEMARWKAKELLKEAAELEELCQAT